MKLAHRLESDNVEGVLEIIHSFLLEKPCNLFLLISDFLIVSHIFICMGLEKRCIREKSKLPNKV